MGRIQNTVEIPIYRVLPYPVINASPCTDRILAVHQRPFTSGPYVYPTSMARDVSAPAFPAFSIICARACGGGLEPRLSNPYIEGTTVPCDTALMMLNLF